MAERGSACHVPPVVLLLHSGCRRPSPQCGRRRAALLALCRGLSHNGSCTEACDEQFYVPTCLDYGAQVFGQTQSRGGVPGWLSRLSIRLRLRFVSSSPTSGSVLTAHSGACFGFWVSLFLSALTPLTLSLSNINKQKNNLEDAVKIFFRHLN